MKKNQLFLILILSLILNSVMAKSYYIDSNTGNDKNKGLAPDKAWKSLEKLNDEKFEAGDTIYFVANSIFKGQFVAKGDGKVGKVITVVQYGKGNRPRIDAEGKFNEALLVKNVEYWNISDLELTNTGANAADFRYGVRVLAESFGVMHEISLKNLFVHDVNGSLVKGSAEGCGILFQCKGKKKSAIDGLLIEDCKLVKTDRNGICGESNFIGRDNWFPSLKVVIRKNNLEDIGGDGIKPWGCDGALVEYNVVKKGRQRCTDAAAGIWPWSCDNTLIQYNEVSGMKGTKDGQGFDSDYNCKNTVFQYNYSHDNEGGFMLICTPRPTKTMIGCENTIIRYNISQNDGCRTFRIAGACKNTLIHNNTIYVGKGFDIPVFLLSKWDDWGSETKVYNNIFFVAGTAKYGRGMKENPDGTTDFIEGFGENTIVFENNCFYGNHKNTPTDKKQVNKNPLLFGAGQGKDGLKSVSFCYRLSPKSPYRNAGKTIENNVKKDFFGNPIGDKLSIGASQN